MCDVVSSAADAGDAAAADDGSSAIALHYSQSHPGFILVVCQMAHETQAKNTIHRSLFR